MKTKSIWGKPPKRIYKLIKLAEKMYGDNFTTCIVGCSDGKFLLPFARKSHFVFGYDVDEVALFGGEKFFPIVNNKKKHTYDKQVIFDDYPIETKKIIGLDEKIIIEKVTKYAK
jgi:hypothetical protein